MSKTPELEFISWQKFHQIGFELSQKINAAGIKPDKIVSISRGGHVLSRILSDFLDLPIFSFSIQSYKALQQHELKITQELAVDLSGKHVLLVDEIIDSGKTLKRALSYLEDLGASQITSVAAHVKHHSIMESDFFIEKTDKWVVYPYEVRETIESLKPIWKEAGLSEADLKTTLINGGFGQELTDTYI